MTQSLSDIVQVILLIKIQSCMIYTLYSEAKILWYENNFIKDLPWIITNKCNNVTNI